MSDLAEHFVRIPVSQQQLAGVRALVGRHISAGTCALLRRRGYSIKLESTFRSPKFYLLDSIYHPSGTIEQRQEAARILRLIPVLRSALVG